MPLDVGGGVLLGIAVGLSYLFEASVGGGIPIIRPLSQCLAANEIEEICGILNGTTPRYFRLPRCLAASMTSATTAEAVGSFPAPRP